MDHAYQTAAAILSALLLIIAVAFFSLNPRTASAVHSNAITGYAWSDTIGWISLNCVDGGTNGSDICGTFPYGLIVDPANGNISGYAWSDNIGWVSANVATGCPSGTCTARINGSTISGWLKALAGGSAQSGGWDGWISLSGSGIDSTGLPFSYGITKKTDGTFTGYAWGSAVVGWVDFKTHVVQTHYSVCTPSTVYTCVGVGTVRTTVTDPYCVVTTSDEVCDPPKYCSPGVSTCLESPPTITRHLEAIPQLVKKGGTTKLYWDVSNVKRCTVSGNGQTWNLKSSGTAGRTTTAINQRTVYTMTCTQMNNTTFTETATISVSPVFQER